MVSLNCFRHSIIAFAITIFSACICQASDDLKIFNEFRTYAERVTLNAMAKGIWPQKEKGMSPLYDAYIDFINDPINNKAKFINELQIIGRPHTLRVVYKKIEYLNKGVPSLAVIVPRADDDYEIFKHTWKGRIYTLRPAKYILIPDLYCLTRKEAERIVIDDASGEIYYINLHWAIDVMNAHLNIHNVRNSEWDGSDDSVGKWLAISFFKRSALLDYKKNDFYRYEIDEHLHVRDYLYSKSVEGIASTIGVYVSDVSYSLSLLTMMGKPKWTVVACALLASRSQLNASSFDKIIFNHWLITAKRDPARYGISENASPSDVIQLLPQLNEDELVKLANDSLAAFWRQAMIDILPKLDAVDAAVLTNMGNFVKSVREEFCDDVFMRILDARIRFYLGSIDQARDIIGSIDVGRVGPLDVSDYQSVRELLGLGAFAPVP